MHPIDPPVGPSPLLGLNKAINTGAKVVRRMSKPSARSSNSSRSSGSSGSSSRNSGGGSSFSGGGGSGRSIGGGGSSSAPPKAPVIPSLAAYLGTDSAYQQAVSGGKRTLADYISDIARRRGEATTQFDTTQAGMERDRANQLDQLKQEFASRGLINSGLFGQKEGEFQQQYNDQLNSLGQQQTGLLADLVSQQSNYKREYDLAIQQAKQEAIARRAAKYNIG